MESFLFYLAMGSLAFFLLLGIDLWRGNGSLSFLGKVEPPPGFAGPPVSVIVAARNEEKTIRPALLSLLQQDYRPLEVVVVNDRSSDGTGQVLQQISLQYPGLRILDVHQLPEGWLGKNHALHLGARETAGELLLFTDADVIMHPSTVSRAVYYLQEKRRDHLTLGPDVILPGMWLKMFVGVFALFFSSFLRPWKASDPSSRCYVGIGAFNMVRREVYQTIGTHRAIRMRPDDDLKLGKLIKRGGHSQEFVFGKGLLEVQWYSSMGQLIDGLMKNMFAGVDYRVSAVLAISTLQLLLFVWPFPACLLTGGWTRLMNLGILALVALFCQVGSRFTGIPAWTFLGFPLMVLLWIYIQWRAMLLTLLNRGISWRGTHYALDELKSNRV